LATVVVATATANPNADSIGVDCTGSARAVGGGVTTTDTAPGSLLTSAPTEANSTTDLAEAGDTPTGWFGAYTDIGPAGETLTVFAICVS
jgi:hypothetical protein